MDESGTPPRITRALSSLHKRELARGFRKHPTASEEHAWGLLRDRRLMGLKFRRQQVIVGYVVDFYCPQLRLVVEIDGGVHDDDEARIADAARTRAIEKEAVSVVRIDAAKLDAESLCSLIMPFTSSH